MKSLQLIVTAVISLMLFLPASAGLPDQPKFSWSAPTQYTDGSDLDAAVDIEKYTLNCSPDINAQEIVIPAGELNEWTAPLGLFPAGTYTCTMTVTVTAEKGGATSAASEANSFSVMLVPGVITFIVE